MSARLLQSASLEFMIQFIPIMPCMVSASRLQPLTGSMKRLCRLTAKKSPHGSQWGFLLFCASACCSAEISRSRHPLISYPNTFLKLLLIIFARSCDDHFLRRDNQRSFCCGRAFKHLFHHLFESVNHRALCNMPGSPFDLITFQILRI